MKKLAVCALAALAVAACGSDNGGTNVEPQHEIVGSWISTGANLAAGFKTPSFKLKQIVATFNTNNTYTVVSTDSSNATVTYTGTWQANSGTNGTIRQIQLYQATPTTLTSTGIFQVIGTGTAKTMKYEVIQTTPAIQGFTAPTVTGGFGSTAYNGTSLGATWTQVYTPQ